MGEKEQNVKVEKGTLRRELDLYLKSRCIGSGVSQSGKAFSKGLYLIRFR
jgi:hypothetical protein